MGIGVGGEFDRGLQWTVAVHLHPLPTGENQCGPDKIGPSDRDGDRQPGCLGHRRKNDRRCGEMTYVHECPAYNRNHQTEPHRPWPGVP